MGYGQWKRPDLCCERRLVGWNQEKLRQLKLAIYMNLASNHQDQKRKDTEHQSLKE